MRIIHEPKYDFEDVLFLPKRSTLVSRKEVELYREYTYRNSGTSYNGVPIIAANMDTVGTFEMANALSEHGVSTAIHKHYTLDDLIGFFSQPHNASVFYSTGITDSDLDKLSKVHKEAFVRNICVDVANGYSQRFDDTIKRLRDDYPESVIMAGNVVTGEMTEQLILSGADIVKIGIGPGSVCTTRKLTGVGHPQLSAVIECADSAHGLGGLVCSDGGCQVPGDVAKAFGAGADFVMLGGMLAGHKESGGSVTDGKMEFYGMSSEAAMKKHSGGVANYRAAEGKRVLIDYKGEVNSTIQEILGGIRSTCTYVGAKNLKSLSKCTTFITVGRQLNGKFN